MSSFFTPDSKWTKLYEVFDFSWGIYAPYSLFLQQWSNIDKHVQNQLDKNLKQIRHPFPFSSENSQGEYKNCTKGLKMKFDCKAN